MAQLFTDDMESYTVGQDPPNTYHFLDIGFFKGQVVNNVLHRNTGTRVYQMGLNGQLMFHFSSLVVDTTVYWVGINTPNFTFGQSTATASADPGVNFGWFQVETDRTVSLYANSKFGTPGTAVLIGNSAPQVTHTDVWQDYQVSFHTEPAVTVVGTVTRTTLQVKGNIFVEGALLVNSGLVNTDLDISSLPLGAQYINNWQFNGNGYIDNIWAVDSLVGTATFPFINGGTGTNTTKALVTQGVTEILKRPDRSARITQGAVETIKRFTPQVRVTQGAIEVIKRGNTSQWQVYEA